MLGTATATISHLRVLVEAGMQLVGVCPSIGVSADPA
jgi:hypothetical protein